jgi:hypothetical protein
MWIATEVTNDACGRRHAFTLTAAQRLRRARARTVPNPRPTRDLQGAPAVAIAIGAPPPPPRAGAGADGRRQRSTAEGTFFHFAPQFGSRILIAIQYFTLTPQYWIAINNRDPIFFIIPPGVDRDS